MTRRRGEDVRAAEEAKATESGPVDARRNLHEILVEHGPLPVNELFRRAGYREEKPSEVEDFYRLLLAARTEKKVAPVSDAEADHVVLKAVAR